MKTFKYGLEDKPHIDKLPSAWEGDKPYYACYSNLGLGRSYFVGFGYTAREAYHAWKAAKEPQLL